MFHIGRHAEAAADEFWVMCHFCAATDHWTFALCPAALHMSSCSPLKEGQYRHDVQVCDDMLCWWKATLRMISPRN